MVVLMPGTLGRLEFVRVLRERRGHYEPGAFDTRGAPPRRNLVIRSDGKTVNVPRRQGHLFVCATGCCCGHTDRGHAPVMFHN